MGRETVEEIMEGEKEMDWQDRAGKDVAHCKYFNLGISTINE
jgi:hypothetical protein